MRNILIIMILMISIAQVFGQNIGIGVGDPQYKLDLGGALNLRYVTNTPAGILFDGPTLPTSSFLGMKDDNIFGVQSNISNTWPFQMNVNTGNLGIGNITPSYKLDIKGRPRIRHNGSSAAIWFDGPTMAQSSLFGTVNNDHVGFWGNDGAGWNFAMNVNNGYTGIGTSTPTATLDVNGSFRMRGSFPITGSYVMSADANGNADWVNPIAFKASGGYDDEPNVIVDTISSVWFKIYFNQVAQYNIGASYQSVQSQFVAPENGVYHFETVLEWENYTDRNSVRLRLNRNGSIYDIATSYKNGMAEGANYYFGVQQPSRLSSDVKLLAGDIVWIEAKANNLNAPGYPNTNTVSASHIKTWFTGNLVTRLP